MLSNAYFLAKFRFDTAENEPAKNLQKPFPKSSTLMLAAEVPAPSGREAAGRPARSAFPEGFAGDFGAEGAEGHREAEDRGRRRAGTACTQFFFAKCW